MSKYKRSSRKTSRTAAIQALYQMKLSDQTVERVISDFQADRFSDEVQYYKPDIPFFKDLVTGVCNHDQSLTDLIDGALDNKKLANQSVLMTLIVKLALFEITYYKTPKPVAINEYVELSKEFLSEKDVPFINSFLDTLPQ